MKSKLLLAADAGLFLLGTLLAIALRDGEAIDRVRAISFAPYLLATTVSVLLLWPAFGIHRSIWRLSRLPDYLWLLVGTVVAVAGATSMVFAYDRLQSIPRSLPILQAVVVLALLVGARIATRLNYQRRLSRAHRPELLVASAAGNHQRVLVVGIGPVAELYLRVAQEAAGNAEAIVGLLGRTDKHVGRLVAGRPVLGLPEQISEIIDQLEVHGVQVDAIVVAMRREELSSDALEALLRLQSTTEIELKFLQELLGLDQAREAAHGQTNADKTQLEFHIPSTDLASIRRRGFWRLKRVVDVAASAILLVVCAPIFLAVSAAVALSMGLPVVFWQQRPGLGGRPFRVYKFRTMGAARDYTGRLRSDAERTSQVGNFLRRVRLDELPQLLNILLGHMSFIGPRPLLPRDQMGVSNARLLVRPGLTGWAQVIGGRDISAADKAALDVWYVQNASFALDMEIVVRTIGIVLFGERANQSVIDQIWRDLDARGVCSREQ